MKIAMTLLAALSLLAPLSLAAQTQNSKGRFYVLGAPGGAVEDLGSELFTLHAAGGGEVFIQENISLGAEIGMMLIAGPEELDANVRLLNGLLSANAAYHFGAGDPDRKTVPFLTGGYSTKFPRGIGTLYNYNFGGGLNYWFRRKLGLRLEFRNHIFNSRFSNPFATEFTVHYWQIRAGLSFR